MEYDCEMFDDSEAALDALLGKAHWPDADASALQRLTALIESPLKIAAEAEAEVVSGPLDAPEEPVTWEEESPTEPPTREVESSAEAPTREGEAPAEPDLQETIPEFQPIAPEPPRETSVLPIARRRRRLEWLALAASIVLLIGLITIVARQMTRPPIAAIAQAPLPGRAPTPMELWLISPAGQKYLASRQAPPVLTLDPHERRIVQLCQRADSQSLSIAMLKESEPESRARLLAAMFQRSDGANRFLDLVRNRATRDRALDALQSLPQPPVDVLMAELDNPSVERRFAAAKSLGCLCHGESLPVLKRMIETRNHTREALAVLSECNDAAATQYVRQIKHSPAMSAQLKTVRDEMNSLF